MISTSPKFSSTAGTSITDRYVNSMADYDLPSGNQNRNFPDLQWKLQTNSYECVLKDKQSNVIKLQSAEKENFHNKII